MVREAGSVGQKVRPFPSITLLGGAVVTSRLRGDAMATFPEELAASGWCRSCARQGPLIYNACPALTM
jgi:hypothetical protein